MVAERRNRKRALIKRPVMVILSSGAKVKAQLFDVAENGIGIITQISAEIGAVLVFKFSLPYKNEMQPFTIKGKIIYSHIRADKYVSGVQFMELESDKVDLIKLIITEINSKKG